MFVCSSLCYSLFMQLLECRYQFVFNSSFHNLVLIFTPRLLLVVICRSFLVDLLSIRCQSIVIVVDRALAISSFEKLVGMTLYSR